MVSCPIFSSRERRASTESANRSRGAVRNCRSPAGAGCVGWAPVHAKAVRTTISGRKVVNRTSVASPFLPRESSRAYPKVRLLPPSLGFILRSTRPGDPHAQPGPSAASVRRCRCVGNRARCRNRAEPRYRRRSESRPAGAGLLGARLHTLRPAQGAAPPLRLARQDRRARVLPTLTHERVHRADGVLSRPLRDALLGRQGDRRRVDQHRSPTPCSSRGRATRTFRWCS